MFLNNDFLTHSEVSCMFCSLKLWNQLSVVLST